MVSFASAKNILMRYEYFHLKSRTNLNPEHYAYNC